MGVNEFLGAVETRGVGMMEVRREDTWRARGSGGGCPTEKKEPTPSCARPAGVVMMVITLASMHLQVVRERSLRSHGERSLREVTVVKRPA